MGTIDQRVKWIQMVGWVIGTLHCSVFGLLPLSLGTLKSLGIQDWNRVETMGTGNPEFAPALISSIDLINLGIRQ